MTVQEAKEYARTMTFRDAIYNLKQARCVPYRKATFIKINELLEKLETIERVGVFATVYGIPEAKPKERPEGKLYGLKADNIIYDEWVGQFSEELGGSK